MVSLSPHINITELFINKQIQQIKNKITIVTQTMDNHTKTLTTEQLLKKITLFDYNSCQNIGHKNQENEKEQELNKNKQINKSYQKYYHQSSFGNQREKKNNDLYGSDWGIEKYLEMDIQQSNKRSQGTTRRRITQSRHESLCDQLINTFGEETRYRQSQVHSQEDNVRSRRKMNLKLNSNVFSEGIQIKNMNNQNKYGHCGHCLQVIRHMHEVRHAQMQQLQHILDQLKQIKSM